MFSPAFLLLAIVAVAFAVCPLQQAATVGKPAPTKLDKAQQDAILEVHNRLRSELARGVYVAKGAKQPSAANMKKLKWSEEIAKSAQGAANLCLFEHTGGKYGENIYALSAKRLENSGRGASEQWAKEFQSHGIKSLNFTKETLGTGIGHASQMAWAESEEIGCGAAICDGLKFPTILFCQYYPRGNMLNGFIYQTGATCSKCENGFVCEKNSGLCVRK